MLSNDLKSKINKLWDKFWSRGITNPITAIEQISYLLFLRRIDDADRDVQTKNNKYKTIFKIPKLDSNGNRLLDKKGKTVLQNADECRWSNFSIIEDVDELLNVVSNRAFPFIKNLNDPNQPYTRHMQNAVFDIKSATLLREAIDDINSIFEDISKQKEEGQQFQDTQGDVYEYLINEIGTSGKNGQFRTPRHIIQFMCEIINPDIDDKICDPACGTGGFLLGAYQHILTKYTQEENLISDENGLMRFKRNGGEKIDDQKTWNKLNNATFFGFDIDQNMVRIGLMNLMLHGIKVPQIENLDTLSQGYDEKHNDGEYSVVLANPPFTGRINKDEVSDLLVDYGTQSELLFVNRISRMLRKGGRAAVIIPEGVLFSGSKNQKSTREVLLKDNNLEAVISLPSGVFKPYAGVKTSILIFTKIKTGSTAFNTEKVWFYELLNDGYSLDDNRRKLSDNPLPIAKQAFDKRGTDSQSKRLTHFYVPVNEIQENSFDLSYNRYKQFEYEEQSYIPPKEILAALFKLEIEIQEEMEDLKKMIE